jgi:limonene-1,2-epoxide hydrolase
MSGDIETMCGEFTKAATAYCAAIRTGDSRSANRHVHRAADVYRKLRAQGEVGQAAILALLRSDDEAIRYMAAVHALDFAPEKGERVLTEIMLGPPSPVRLLAQTSLSQWRSGLLRF